MINFKNRLENYLILKYIESSKCNSESQKKILELVDGNLLLEKGSDSVHPDNIDLLYNYFTIKLPVNCCKSICNIPVLIHPETFVIFGVVEGTFPPLLRLPKKDQDILIEKGAKKKLENLEGIYADSDLLGKEWVYCYSFIEGIQDYCLKAYEYAGKNF